jgi:hypothetical protein
MLKKLFLIGFVGCLFSLAIITMTSADDDPGGVCDVWVDVKDVSAVYPSLSFKVAFGGGCDPEYFTYCEWHIRYWDNWGDYISGDDGEIYIPGTHGFQKSIPEGTATITIVAIAVCINNHPAIDGAEVTVQYD